MESKKEVGYLSDVDERRNIEIAWSRARRLVREVVPLRPAGRTTAPDSSAYQCNHDKPPFAQGDWKSKVETNLEPGGSRTGSSKAAFGVFSKLFVYHHLQDLTPPPPLEQGSGISERACVGEGHRCEEGAENWELEIVGQNPSGRDRHGAMNVSCEWIGGIGLN